MISQIEEADAKNRIILSKTKLIRQKDIESDERWANVYQEYEEAQAYQWRSRAVVSFINAIVFHQRVYFGLTRENLRELLSQDQNWKDPIGLKNENYKKFIEFITIAGLVEKVDYESNERQLLILKVVNLEILSMLKEIDQEQQRIDALAFAAPKKEAHPFEKIASSLLNYQKFIDGKWITLYQILVANTYQNNPDIELKTKSLKERLKELDKELYVLDEENPEYDLLKDEHENLTYQIASIQNSYFLKEYIEHNSLYVLLGGRTWTMTDRKRERENKKIEMNLNKDNQSRC